MAYCFSDSDSDSNYESSDEMDTTYEVHLIFDDSLISLAPSSESRISTKFERVVPCSTGLWYASQLISWETSLCSMDARPPCCSFEAPHINGSLIPRILFMTPCWTRVVLHFFVRPVVQFMWAFIELSSRLVGLLQASSLIFLCISSLAGLFCCSLNDFF